MWLNAFSRNNLKQNIPQARSLNWNVSIKNCALAIFVFIFGLFLLGNVTVVSAIKMLVVILLNFA